MTYVFKVAAFVSVFRIFLFAIFDGDLDLDLTMWILIILHTFLIVKYR
jgi:hypothetical protein